MTGWSLGGVTVNSDGGFGRMWEMVAETTGLDPVTIKAFLAFGMLLDNGAAPGRKTCRPRSDTPA